MCNRLKIDGKILSFAVYRKRHLKPLLWYVFATPNVNKKCGLNGARQVYIGKRRVATQREANRSAAYGPKNYRQG